MPVTDSTPWGPSSTNVTPAKAFLSRENSGMHVIGARAFGRAKRQLVARDHTTVLGDAIVVDAVELPGDLGGVDETDRDRFAVMQVVVARGLERMGERVSVVQDRTAPALALVARHDVGLDAHARRDTLVERQRVEVATAEEVVLGHLAQTAAHFARRQRRQHRGVADDGVRLPVRAHEILAFGQVHTRLAPDGGVDLSQQRRRDMDDGYATVVAGRGEPRDIGDHASPDGDDDIGACEAPLREPAAQRLDRRERLGFFTLADEEDTVFDAGVHLVRNAALRHDRGAARRCAATACRVVRRRRHPR